MGITSPVFTVEYDDELVVYIDEMEKAMHGLTMTNVKRLAYDLAERASSLIHRFDRNTKLAGREWLSGFMKRHLTIRLPKNGRFQPEGGQTLFVIYIYIQGIFGHRRV